MFKHWQYKTKLYKVWCWMKSRCDDKNHIRYYIYWWKWITYDSKWKTWEWFYEDMWADYKEWLTLERKKWNKNYCKSNCKWATYKEQARNTTRTILYKWKCLKDWCLELDINYSTATTRISRGKSIEQTLELI
jgi:hypothetical protein